MCYWGDAVARDMTTFEKFIIVIICLMCIFTGFLAWETRRYMCKMYLTEVVEDIITDNFIKNFTEVYENESSSVYGRMLISGFPDR